MLVVGSQKYDRHCDTVIISLDTKKRARRIVLDAFASIVAHLRTLVFGKQVFTNSVHVER